jgi:hypothetical protein
MEIWLLTLIFLAISLIGMAIGVIIGGQRKSLKGSCGGLNAVMGDKNKECDFCGKKEFCENEKEFAMRAQKKLDPLI